MLLVALSWGCWSDAPPVEPVAAWRPSSDPEHTVPFLPGQGVPLRLQFNGMNSLYRSFVSDPELLTPLSQALVGCVTGTATLSVSYVDSTRVGRIALVIPRDQLTCHGAAAGEGVDVSGLVPLTTAVAAWRNSLGAAKDMRLYTFRTALHVEDAQGAVSLWLDGQDPIDGTAFGPCLGIDGVEVCTGEAAPQGQVVFLPHEVRWRRRLRAVLAD